MPPNCKLIPPRTSRTNQLISTLTQQLTLKPKHKLPVADTGTMTEKYSTPLRTKTNIKLTTLVHQLQVTLSLNSIYTQNIELRIMQRCMSTRTILSGQSTSMTLRLMKLTIASQSSLKVEMAKLSTQSYRMLLTIKLLIDLFGLPLNCSG